MRNIILSACWLAFTYSAAFGQSADQQFTFEVASVKPTAMQRFDPNIIGIKGGPGSTDPGRITYTGLTLRSVLLIAYGVRNDQIYGPGWLDTERYDFIAKVPPGTTKDQLNAMLRNLLVERFNLTSHHETKNLPVYELLTGKNGPKLKEANLNVPPPPEPGVPPRMVGMPDKDGFPQLPPGSPFMVGRVADGRMHLTAKAQSVEQIAAFLGGQVRRAVLNKTGLTGKYDFTLEFSAAGVRSAAGALDTSDSGLSIEGAVQEQLGLKLESKKVPSRCSSSIM